MTSVTETHPSPSRSLALQPLRAKWGWIIALGIVYVIVGLVALGSVATATAATVFLVGAMMVVAGRPKYSTRSKSELGANFHSGFCFALLRRALARARGRAFAT
jgi:uncharacterized membrane protein HdeD (DUF308 family)